MGWVTKVTTVELMTDINIIEIQNNEITESYKAFNYLNDRLLI